MCNKSNLLWINKVGILVVPMIKGEIMVKIEKIEKIEINRCNKCGKMYVQEDESDKCKECKDKHL